jgi:type I restriction enzyme S subunit
VSGLPKGWATARLEDLTENPKQDIVDGPFGSNLKASEYVEAGIPIVRLQNIDRNRFLEKNIRCVTSLKAKELSRHSFRSGDVIITKLGDPVGKACVVPSSLSQGIIVADVVRARIDERNALKEFVVYAINSPEVVSQINLEVKGSTRPRVNLGHIRALEIPLPPLNEQRRIVAKLETLLGKVDACQQRLAKIPGILKRFRQSILAAACSGRLTADWREENLPDQDGVALLSEIDEARGVWLKEQIKLGSQEAKRIQSKLRDHTFDPPKNLEVPELWAWSSFLKACTLVVDCHNKTAPYESQGIPLVRTTNVKSGRLLWNDMKYVSPETYKYWSRRCPPAPGDILFTREAPMGECTVIPTNTTICLGQRMMLLRTDSERLLPMYVSYAIQDPNFQLRIGDNAIGSGVKHLRVGDVEELVIPIPPLPEQHEIVRHVEALFTLADQLEARYAKAKAHVDKLTQSIFAKAFRGELVPQDENDEPASVLLERIRAAKAPSPLPLSRRARGARPNPRPLGEGGAQRRVREILLAAEPSAAYDTGGQAAFSARNQPVPDRILSAMEPGRDYSRAELTAASGITDAQWTWAIRQLKEEGKVTQTGERRGARYRRALL